MPRRTDIGIEVHDAFSEFSGGVNKGIAPMLLPRNQLADTMNVTVRGTYATHRPSYRKMTVDFGVYQSAIDGGKFQGGCVLRPDTGLSSICTAFSGKFYKWTIDGNTATITHHAVAGGDNDATRDQAWLWQAEKWVIWNDGLANPVFFNSGANTIARSTFGATTTYNTTTAAQFTVPDLGVNVSVTVTDATNVAVGDVIIFNNLGSMEVLDISGAPVIVFRNVSATPKDKVVSSGRAMSWIHPDPQLPPGRMGTYVMGRNWISDIDGKQFFASDLVGGSSGSFGEQYRDAVLNITENLYLAGGGNFAVPGTVGAIRAIKAVANLDASMGQGPVQVGTPDAMFSVNAPVDRLTWQDLANPILSQSLLGGGPLGQDSTVNANGDLIFRSQDGIRSLILGRRDFDTWGNVPISREVEPILKRDSPDLLRFGSAVVFDNRLLMTVWPVYDVFGVYHKGIVALNFDPVSSLRGKAPSVYDGLWVGLNVLKLFVGEFSGVQRCFALTLNSLSNGVELYEILKDGDAHYDNDVMPISWKFQSPVLFQQNPRDQKLLRLVDGEIHVDEMKGRVDFQVYYRPDQYPCWVPWHNWSECALEPVEGDTATVQYKPQFRPNMGLGEPSPDPCDESNNRPLREGYSFQFKVEVVGHCRIVGARFKAVTVGEPKYSEPVCDEICDLTDTNAGTVLGIGNTIVGNGDEVIGEPQ